MDGWGRAERSVPNGGPRERASGVARLVVSFDLRCTARTLPSRSSFRTAPRKSMRYVA